MIDGGYDSSEKLVTGEGIIAFVGRQFLRQTYRGAIKSRVPIHMQYQSSFHCFLVAVHSV
jgi:hypothetical protein